MRKHTLFLLHPGFFDGEDGPFFCPHNAAMEGLLKYEPTLESKLDVQRVEFQRPRQEIIKVLGEENQNLPVLVLDETQEAPIEAQISAETGRAFIVGEIAISNYLHKNLSTFKPH
jgi:hypothetical protein